MAKLFESLDIGKMKIKNRIVMPPMCVYSADEDGVAKDFHLVHYGARALGGVGFIIMEATGVSNAGRITNNCLGLWNEEQADAIKRIVDMGKSAGCKMGIQLQHAGRKCEVSSVDEIFAPSAISFGGKYRTPKEMTKSHITQLVEDFGNSAKLAEKAGFDAIEVHGAHGYLISTFLSPLSNKREDEYGGTPENMARIARQVLASVRANFSGTVGIRVSAEDYAPGGNSPEDMANLINFFKDELDFIDVSSGGVVDMEKRAFFPGYQTTYAEIIKKAVDIPIITGGLLHEPEHMEAILSNDRADMVFVGRRLLADPAFPLFAAKKMGVDVKWPKQYTAGK